MERQYALGLSFIFFIVFSTIAYYGVQITVWSSIIFGLFAALILLNIFYPPSQITGDDPDSTLVLYAAVEISGLILLAIYIAQKTLSDVRLYP